MVNVNLWIDDERAMPKGFTHWVKTSQEAIDFLSSLGSSDTLVTVSFDHDLGYAFETGKDFDDNSRRVAMWMSEHNVWPELVQIHTQNPIGAAWLQRLFEYDGPEGMTVIRRPYTPKDYS